ncbi:MAG TPA: DUF1616 domain-containing protein [Thermoplasmata archaeon]|nr:DUF1616 domain-containing protein [Thermoplasmata archaeon]
MTTLDPILFVFGILLVFVLPGYTVTKAVFPDWRVRGPTAGLVAVQLAALTLVTSVALTVLVGFALLVLPGQGFAATWGDPVLEEALAVISAGALVIGLVRGAYHRIPPPAHPLEPAPGADDGWGLLDRLHAIDRERRRIRHALRRGMPSDVDAQRQRELLERLDHEADTLQRQREAEYAG